MKLPQRKSYLDFFLMGALTGFLVALAFATFFI